MTHVECQPQRAAFRETAHPGARMVVVCELLADELTPVRAYRVLAAGAQHAFLLESVEHAAAAGHYSFVGVDPQRIASLSADGERDPLDAMRAEAQRPVVYPADVAMPRFVGGVVGFLGYECAALWERVPVAPAADGDIPDAVLLLAETVVAFDHARHRVIVLTSVAVDAGDDLDQAYDAAVARVGGVIDRLAEVPLDATPRVAPMGLPSVGDASFGTPNTSRAQFEQAVREVQGAIVDGEAIQVVLSQRWDRTTHAAPLDIYRALRVVNPSPYMYLVRLGDVELVGASPELMVRVTDREVVTRPIAGTRPRGSTAEQDAALERELLADPKECAEHAMLVDLGRNDVGRVAVPGSVQVTSLMEVERYSHVMHLTSEVVGELLPDLDACDALRACFPAGTVSGAPKVRAMELIAALEGDRRGPYAGAVGYLGFDGALDMAITIRTIVQRGRTASVQAGAGIVVGSDPANEYEETRSKARALVRAVLVAEQLADQGAGGRAGVA